MIDTHRTGIGEHVMHHIAVHLESGLFEGDRVKRRLAPILALLVEHVRRGTDRGALGEAFRIPPHIGSCRMHADGHIRDDADLHTGLAGGLLRRVQLIGGDPLKPAVELKGVRELLTQLRDFFGITVVFAHPIIGVVGGSAPLVVAQAPGGVGFDLVSAFGEVTVEFGLVSLGSAGLVDDPQRMLLDAPHGVAIDQPRVVIQRFDLLVQRIDLGPVLVGQREIFRHGLRTDVAEIDETAGNRQIRRWRQRRHRLRGVHRVDKHEVGAGLLFSLDQHGLQIFEVSHAPGSLGTDGVQLAHPPPQGAVLHIIEQFDFLRSADNGCSLRFASDSDLEGVIAFGQIGGQDEIRHEEEAAIDLMGDFLTALMGDFARELLAVFQRDGGFRHIEHAAVHLHLAFLAHDMQHGGSHHASFAFGLDGCDGLVDRLIVGSVNTKRLEHRH